MSNKAKRLTGKRTVGMFSVVALGGVTVLSGTGIAAAASRPNTVVSGATGPTTATTIYPGKAGQAVGSESFTITNSFTAADTIAILVGTAGDVTTTSPPPPVTTTTPAVNSSTTPGDYVEFDGTPTVTVSANTTAETTALDTKPAITGALSTNTADSNTNKNAAVTDELKLSFGNSSTGTAGDTYTVTLTGITYSTGTASGSSSGAVPVAITDTTSAPADTTPLPVNASIANTILTEAPTGIQVAGALFGPPTPVAMPVSDIVLTETVPDTVTGTVTIHPTDGAFVGTPTVTAPGVVVTAATISGNNVTFNVTTPSTTTPATFTISGLSFLADFSSGADPVTVTYDGSTTVSTAQPAITIIDVDRTAGATADDTAAANAELYGFEEGINTVLLASDAGFQDALSASYLSQELRAPILLNPPTVPTGGESSTAAARAIRAIDSDDNDTVKTVDIIGGPDAISPAVATALETMQVGVSSDGLPIYMQVNRIYGQTAEDTAQQVAQYPGLDQYNQMEATPGAYGLYNDGMSESTAIAASPGSLKTAILTSGDEFQDALAASGLAAQNKQADGYPLLLTSGSTLSPAASSAFTNLGIQQVIVVGGSAVVSDADVAAIEAQGISVLRIAGQTFSDTANALAAFELSQYSAGGTPPPPPPPPTTTTTTIAPTTTTIAPTTTTTIAPTTTTTGGTVTATPALAEAARTGVAGDTPLAGVIDGLDVEGDSPTVTVATSRGDSPYDALTASPILGSEGDAGPIPLLLSLDTGTAGSDTLGFFSEAGTTPNGGFTVYNQYGVARTVSINGLSVFGGTLAQPIGLIQSEIDAIAAG